MGSASFFFMGPDSEYFKLYSQYSFCWSHSALSPRAEAAIDAMYNCVPVKFYVEKKVVNWILPAYSLPASVLDENNKWN